MAVQLHTRKEIANLFNPWRRIRELEQRVAELERQLDTRAVTDEEIEAFERAFRSGQRRKESPWAWDQRGF